MVRQQIANLPAGVSLASGFESPALRQKGPCVPQMAEGPTFNRNDVGSSPTARTTERNRRNSLTVRRPFRTRVGVTPLGVRIPLPPPWQVNRTGVPARF